MKSPRLHFALLLAAATCCLTQDALAQTALDAYYPFLPEEQARARSANWGEP